MIIPYSGLDTPHAIVVFDIDGVVRDVAQSYRRAIADTVEHFTQGAFRPTIGDIDLLKTEGIWNNDWKASEELIYRFYETQGKQRHQFGDHYAEIVDFFQDKYRGDNFSGYIKDEPLLMSEDYLQSLSDHQIAWGFFSGATQGSAHFVLTQRLSIQDPILVAMEDAPSKPNPKGLFLTIEKMQAHQPIAQEQDWEQIPVLYVGDTVADIQTALNASAQESGRRFVGVGILPPHAQGNEQYTDKLLRSGAVQVFDRVKALTATKISSKSFATS